MRKSIGFLAFLALLSPVSAFAFTWWNPSTWFLENGSTTTPQIIAVQIDDPTYSTSTEELPPVEAPAPTSTVQTVVKTVVQTNTVTKYVDNPELIAQINILKTQVNQLRATQCTVGGAVVDDQVISESGDSDEGIEIPSNIDFDDPTPVYLRSGQPTEKVAQCNLWKGYDVAYADKIRTLPSEMNSEIQTKVYSVGMSGSGAQGEISRISNAYDAKETRYRADMLALELRIKNFCQ